MSHQTAIRNHPCVGQSMWTFANLRKRLPFDTQK